MSFISVAAGQTIRATHVQQFTNWLTAQKLDTPGTIACTSTTEYTLTVRAQDGGTGLALNVLYGSASSPSTIATFNKERITLASPVRVTGTTPMSFAQMAAPASGPAADFTSLYAKTDGTLAYKVGTGTTENVVLTGTSGTYLTNVLTATGDLIYSSSASTAARLAKGSAYQTLRMDGSGGIPEWGQSPMSVMTAAGDMLYASAANFMARLAKGTAYQTLRMDGSGNLPEWGQSPMSVMTAQGDMLYASAANFMARLPKGTAYQSLVMNSGATAPQWASGPLALVQTAGDVIVGSTANAMTRVAAGTATQVLIGGTAPTFTSVQTTMLATNAVTQIVFAGNTLTEDVSPSTTSATYSTINQMTCAFTSAGGDIVVWAEGDFTVSSSAKACYFSFKLDSGSDTAERSFQQDSASVYAKMYCQHRFTGVASGAHTVYWQWKTTSPATLSNAVRQRSMMVMEVKR